MKDILITGASGLVGSRFVEMYGGLYPLLTPSRKDLDITNLDSVYQYFGLHTIGIIVNLAADTNVSEAENQRGNKTGSCWQINVEGARNLLATGIKLIQISTDMVFSGDAGPYGEEQKAETDSSKVTWYGFSKGEAERLVADQTILRIMYPVRAHFERLDYLRKPLKLFSEGKLYPLFSDQQVSITFIDEASTFLHKIISENMHGTFHAASSDTSTPYDLVCSLLKKTGKDISEVKKSSISSVNNPVRYPKLGGLKTSYPFSTCEQIIDALVEQGIGESR